MTQQRNRRGRVILLLVLAAVIAVVDQVTKYLAEERLTPGVIVPVIGDVLGLQLIYNPGAAFSIATGMTWIFTLISVVVVVVVLRVSRRLRSTAWAMALGLLLGGALGNLYDRLLREPGFAQGHVVDFINYNGWFVGNVADIAIVVAAVLIALLALRGIEVDGTRVPRDDDGEPVPSGTDEDVSEEPLGDDDAFTPEVLRAAEDDVDIASWAADAPSASEVGGRRAAEAGPVRPAEWRPLRPTGAPTSDHEHAVAVTEPAAGTAAAGGAGTAPAGEIPEPARADTGTSASSAEPALGPDEVRGPAGTSPTELRPEPATPPRRPRSRRESRLSADDDG